MTSPTTPLRASAAPALLLSLPLLLSACVDANNRSSIGDVDPVHLEALAGSQPLAADSAIPGSPELTRKDDAPSVTSIDRANWEAQTLLVPVDYTLHRPHYVIPWGRHTNRTARERAQFPSAESALELECRSNDQQAAEALVAPLIALGEGITIPVRLIVEPQWSVWRSPDVAYQRNTPAAQTVAPTTGQAPAVVPPPLPAAQTPDLLPTQPTTPTGEKPPESQPTSQPPAQPTKP